MNKSNEKLNKENSAKAVKSSQGLASNDVNMLSKNIVLDISTSAKPSDPSVLSANIESDSNTCPNGQKDGITKSVQAFFYDEPNTRNRPLPEHSLAESPYHPVISKRDKLYYCRLHPDIPFLYLEAIEQHCKYKEPDKHKEEILKIIQS